MVLTSMWPGLNLVRATSVLTAVHAIAVNVVAGNLQDTRALKTWVRAMDKPGQEVAVRRNLEKLCARWEVVGWRLVLLHNALDQMAHVVGHVRGVEDQMEMTRKTMERLKATLNEWEEETGSAREHLGLGPVDPTQQVIVE